MKPNKIFEILDLAKEIKQSGKLFNPLFVGEAGLGKSAICQQWVAKQRESNPNFGFLDLRIAYKEGPDLVGFPKTITVNGMERTVNCLPDIFPVEGEGLLLLEEPNRGVTQVMNCLMQILTDAKMDTYELPKGWIMAGAINPDSAEYDVNSMDAALRDRFVEFEIDYDHFTFVDFMETQKWDTDIINFIKSGTWIYKKTCDLGSEGSYISPRKWEKLNSARMVGLKQNPELHDITVRSILGKATGNEFHNFCYNECPVLAKDLMDDQKTALKNLNKQSNPKSYRGDLISHTINSIVENYCGTKKTKDKIDQKLMVKVAEIIPADQAINLIKECCLKDSQVAKTTIQEIFVIFMKSYPSLRHIMKNNINIIKETVIKG